MESSYTGSFLIGGAWHVPALKALIGLINIGWALGFEHAIGDDFDLVLAL